MMWKSSRLVQWPEIYNKQPACAMRTVASSYKFRSDMTDTTKLPEALRIAGILRVTGPRHMTSKWIGEAFLELERQHDRIAELEAQLEAVGAGGVGALTAKPVAASARWYMLNKIGMDTLCVDQSNAEQIAKDSDLMWPSMGPHCAVQLVGIGQVAQPTPTPAVVGPLERDRLLAALERAHAAESALRALVDECGNDMVIGWEGRMNERIAHSNKLLAAPQPQQIAETCPVAPSIPGLPRDVVKLLIALATPSMYPRLLPLLEWVKNQPQQIAEPASPWVSVDERLPLESDGTVAVLMDDGSVLTAWAVYWHGSSNGFAQWMHPFDVDGEEVSYWMPLPPTPTKEPS